MRKASDLGEVFALIMAKRGWSQTALARELGRDQSWVSRAVRGKLHPTLPEARAYLDKVGWALYLAPKAEEIDPVKRREFVTAVTSILFVPGDRTGPYQDPAYLRALAAQLRQTYEQIGGSPVAATAMRHLAHVKEAINSPSHALQRASCDLANCVSLVMRNAYRLDDTARVGRFALTLAQKSGYPDGAACALEDLSVLNQARDPRLAAEYARRGLAIHDLTERRRALLNAKFGSALAATKQHGVERASRKALDRALETALDTTDITPDTKATVLGHSGITLAAFARYDESRADFDQAVRIFAESPALYGAWTAKQIGVDLRASDPSQAAENMRSLARVVPLVTSGHLDRLVGDVLRDAAPWSAAPEMKTAIDELKSVRA